MTSAKAPRRRWPSRLKKPSVSAVLFCVVGLLAAAPVGASAQKALQRRPDEYEISMKISEAMRLVSTDPVTALGLLQRLGRQFPGNDRVISRIGYVFQVMGKADSAVVYYQRALDFNPRNLEAGKSLGMFYLTNDQRDKAMAVFEELLAASDHNLNAYKAVGTALRDLGRYDEALDVYRQGRARSERHNILTLEIAELHKANKEYGQALDEYFNYVTDRKGNYRFTRSKILDTIRESGDRREALIASLESKVDHAGGSRFVVLDILAASYLESGYLEKALDMALQADAEKESDGSVMLSLADQVIGISKGQPRAEKKRYLDLGVRALDAFTKNHSRRPGTDRAKYTLATIYRQLGSGDIPGVPVPERVVYLEKAAGEFEAVSRGHSSSEYAELAILERGDLLLHALKRPGDALEAYKVGAVNSRRLGDVFAARIAAVYLGQGKFDDAAHYFEALMGSGVEVLAQTGVYYSGLMLGLKGQYETARDTLAYLAEADPSSPYTNDAIETAWIIEEGLQSGSNSLEGFMRAIQAELLGDTGAVLAQMNRIVSGPAYDVMRPRAMFKLGKTLYETGDLDRAVSILKQFLEEYPKDALRPDVQRTIATIYEVGYEQYEQALREYEVVLMLYPDYAFLDEVRKDVRRLRFIVKGEE